MNRRSVIITCAAGAASFAGCLGGGGGGGFGGTADSDSEQLKDDTGLSTAQRAFVDRLDQELSVNAARVNSDALVVEIQTTGEKSENIRVAAETYVNFVHELSTNLRVHVNDRGLRQATFMIKSSWAQEFRDGAIDDQEYLNRIEETRRT